MITLRIYDADWSKTDVRSGRQSLRPSIPLGSSLSVPTSVPPAVLSRCTLTERWRHRDSQGELRLHVTPVRRSCTRLNSEKPNFVVILQGAVRMNKAVYIYMWKHVVRSCLWLQRELCEVMPPVWGRIVWKCKSSSSHLWPATQGYISCYEHNTHSSFTSFYVWGKCSHLPCLF